MPPLYKYVTLQRALGILRSGEIRMTPPRFLNDPHELCVEINPQSLMRHYRDHLLASGCEKAQADDIARRSIRGMVIDRVERVVAEREEIGILSLSDRTDNMLLWAHYGQEHRGAVLDLDVERLVSDHGKANDPVRLAKVFYGDERIDYIAEDVPLWMTLNHKSSAWSYEREWRLMKAISGLKQRSDSIHVLDLPPSHIKRVILGARAIGVDEEATIKFILESEDHKHVRIEKAIFTSGLIGLDFRPGQEFGFIMLHGEQHYGDYWREHRQWVDFEKLARAEKGVGLES